MWLTVKKYILGCSGFIVICQMTQKKIWKHYFYDLTGVFQRFCPQKKYIYRKDGNEQLCKFLSLFQPICKNKA